ncbi:MAG: glycosyltransferase family 9 protein [Elusimicrobia bacterium]|nr:glycosyltransferase family 9 protein [Elusimicrobiota bacterium]
MKILIVNLGGMGDIIMMSPVLCVIRLKYQDCEISLLCLKRVFEVAKVFKEINKFYLLDNIKIKIFDLIKIARMLKDLRNKKFDYLINLRDTSSFGGNLKMSFLVKAIGASVSMGRSLEGRGKFYDKFYEEKKISDKNEVEITLDLLEPLGIKNASKKIFYPIGENDEKKAFNLFIKENESFKIALNPGAFRDSRRWPIKNWRKLILLINKKYPNSRIFINGSNGEIEMAESLKISDNIHITNGKLKISELVALLSKMDVSINNDSGLMHLAAASGTKVVAIFSAFDDLIRFMPSVDKAMLRIATKNILLNCERPCYKFKCANPVCLNSISPEDVMGKMEELIGNER